MKKNYWATAALAGVLAVFIAPANAAALAENFASNPRQNGWQEFGNTNLFRWNAVNQDLEITWDSAQPNSYFFHPLGTILARNDDFNLAFDLFLSDISSGNESGKTGGFEIAIGLLNIGNATSPGFLRGTGVNETNLLELDYFPAGYYAGYGAVDATISPTIISASNEFASSFNYPFELPTNQWLHISIEYTSSNQTLVTSITTNGVPVGSIQDVVLNSNFSDFRLDAISINNYSSAGDGLDSVLAHGFVDNFMVTTPPSPVQNLTGTFTNNVWQAGFLSRSNWTYTLERTTDFRAWTNVSSAASGKGASLLLEDTNPPVEGAFYRVGANRP
ncbi:MAG TPA: hypothetical protein VKA67_11765 [Verrucomicrobiae bacterium]|nr:hypothetical protein [Verrucomicrobiae bacterium]